MQSPSNTLTRRAALVSTLVFALGSAATAQTAPVGHDGSGTWRFSVAPYFLSPHMSGTINVAGHDIPLDVSPSDVLGNLKFGIMGYAEANNGTWGVGLDFLYMNLEAEGEGTLPVTVGAKQVMGEIDVLRRLSPWAEVLVGGRVIGLESSLDYGGSVIDSTFSASKTWFDPLIGVRLTVPNTGKWLAAFRGDIGGFGIGSDLSWQLAPMVGYRFSRVISSQLSYRVLFVDYQDGTDREEFRYQVTTFGPQLGLSFAF